MANAGAGGDNVPPPPPPPQPQQPPAPGAGQPPAPGAGQPAAPGAGQPPAPGAGQPVVPGAGQPLAPAPQPPAPAAPPAAPLGGAVPPVVPIPVPGAPLGVPPAPVAPLAPGGALDPQLQQFLNVLTPLLNPARPGGPPAAPGDDHITERARQEVETLNASVLNLLPADGAAALPVNQPKLVIPQFSGESTDTTTCQEFLTKFFGLAMLARFTDDPEKGATIMASYLTGSAFKYWDSLPPHIKSDYRSVSACLIQRFKHKPRLELELQLREMKYSEDQSFDGFVSNFQYLATSLDLPDQSTILIFLRRSLRTSGINC